MKAVILAGGHGKRMGDICKVLPKPLVEVCDKPILLHQIETLKKEGVTDFIIVTGYLGEKIENYFKDGNELGVNISYYREDTPLGTAGALFRLDLKDDFLLCNGDLIFDFDLKSMVDFHKRKDALITLLAHPNSHPKDSLSMCTDNEDRVTALYFKKEKPEYYPNLCNAGIEIVSPEILKLYNYMGKADFDKDVLIPGLYTNKVFAYRSAEYIMDAGTPERLATAEAYIKNGIVASKNKRRKQKAVFVDRDGTLNYHKGYITEPEELKLIEKTEEAINILKRLGYLVIVITNQPVIARGECTYEALEKIHNRLQMLLADKGAFVDDIYFCPHHPDGGFEGEITELKIKCSCRKPEPGLILKAEKDYNIDLSSSFMAGDSMSDIIAGERAGCKSVLIDSDNDKYKLTFKSLYEFAEALSKNEI